MSGALIQPERIKALFLGVISAILASGFELIFVDYFNGGSLLGVHKKSAVDVIINSIASVLIIYFSFFIIALVIFYVFSLFFRFNIFNFIAVCIFSFLLFSFQVRFSAQMNFLLEISDDFPKGRGQFMLGTWISESLWLFYSLVTYTFFPSIICWFSTRRWWRSIDLLLPVFPSPVENDHKF